MSNNQKYNFIDGPAAGKSIPTNEIDAIVENGSVKYYSGFGGGTGIEAIYYNIPETNNWSVNKP